MIGMMNNMSAIERQLMMDMRIMNIIKDDNEMEWISPHKDLIFTVTRTENQLWCAEENQGKYVININIKNNLGVNIIDIKFSEIDAVRILDCISTFLVDFDACSGTSMTVYINPNGTRLECPIFDMIRINSSQFEMYDEESEEFSRDINFSVKQYSSIYGTIVNICNVLINDDELENLAFTIFFVGLIDLDVPDELRWEIDNIATKFYSAPHSIPSNFG